jgi:hypothetical protein
MLDEFTNLMRQSAPTIDIYLGEAIEMIDNRLGDGYAKKHPELLGAFIQAASTDYAGSCIGKQIEKAGDTIDRLIDIIEEQGLGCA